MLYRNELGNMLQNLQKKKENINVELKHMPRGDLHVLRRGKSITYNLYMPGDNGNIKRSGITKQDDLVKKATRKEFLLAERVLIDQDINMLNGLINQWLPDSAEQVLHFLPKRCALMESYRMEPWKNPEQHIPHPSQDPETVKVSIQLSISPESVHEWANKPYAENTKKMHHKIHHTECGILTRSKSEAMIVDWYVRKNLAIHYDETLLIGNKWISPDIVFAREDGVLIFHEHWGMTHDAEYVKENIEKLKTYASAGVFPGKNLIITTDEEDGSLDISKVIRMIQSFLD